VACSLLVLNSNAIASAGARAWVTGPPIVRLPWRALPTWARFSRVLAVKRELSIALAKRALDLADRGFTGRQCISQRLRFNLVALGFKQRFFAARTRRFIGREALSPCLVEAPALVLF